MKITIEKLDGGYLVEHAKKRYAFESLETILEKLESIFESQTISREIPITIPADERNHNGINTTDDVIIFNELDRISKKDLGTYFDLDKFNMGYHDQEDGKIVICYGTTKVYTSWEDMAKLPVYIDNKSIEGLNNLKQVAVRTFRKWMDENPKHIPHENKDDDADYKQLLHTDTSTNYDGNKIEGSLEG